MSDILRLRAAGETDGKPFFRTRSRAMARLKGMTRLDGFVVNPAGQDIVIWGRKIDGQPPVFADDFLVALRAATGAYVVVENGRRVRYHPAISLDADGKIFRQLDGLNITSEQERRKYTDICAGPMIVRVDGMPRHTRVAQVLVDADFRMKLVSFGDVKLPIENPFPSSFEAQAETSVFIDQNNISAKLNFLAGRKWFEAGQFTYQTSARGDTYYLDRAQIKLSAQTQQITAAGDLVDGGPPDPFDHNFACSWTDRMEDVLDSEPIWRDMANIYRNFAIAELMVSSNAVNTANIDLRYLLEGHRIKQVKLPDTMPGHSRFLELPSGTMRFFSVCGGVSLGFGSDRLVPSTEASSGLTTVTQSALELAEVDL